MALIQAHYALESRSASLLVESGESSMHNCIFLTHTGLKGPPQARSGNPFTCVLQGRFHLLPWFTLRPKPAIRAPPEGGFLRMARDGPMEDVTKCDLACLCMFDNRRLSVFGQFFFSPAIYLWTIHSFSICVPSPRLTPGTMPHTRMCLSMPFSQSASASLDLHQGLGRVQMQVYFFLNMRPSP